MKAVEKVFLLPILSLKVESLHFTIKMSRVEEFLCTIVFCKVIDTVLEDTAWKIRNPAEPYAVRNNFRFADVSVRAFFAHRDLPLAGWHNDGESGHAVYERKFEGED
jgi:hypothetical protein